MPIRSKRIVEDQLGRKVEIKAKPQRIVSLGPSQTELLFDLGLDDQVVGITKFCVHPEKWFRTKTRVGGTKQVDFEKIKAINPDLIIANKEENTKEDIEALIQEYPVWVSDVSDLNSALEMIKMIGEIVDSDTSDLISKIETGFSALHPLPPRKNAVYLIWRKPFMAAGSDTFINDMLCRCGFENLIEETRYPEVDASKLSALNPEFILLSSEPYPFKEKHIQELQEIVPNAIIELVDGEMFSWYGSRLKLASSYFANLMESIKE